MMLLLTSSLQKAINTLLEHDPVTKSQIKALDGKTFQLHITDMNISIFCQVQHDIVCLFSEWHGEVDTQISGKLLDLVNTARGEGEKQTVANSSVTIAGNFKAGETMRQILSSTQIDIEGLLAKRIGGPLANRLTRIATKTRSHIEQIRQSCRRQVKEYCHQEGKIAIQPRHLSEFKSQNVQLQNATHQLEAKLSKLQSQDN